MIQVRLCWDAHATDWTDVPADCFEAHNMPLLVRLDPPTRWRFNAKMIAELGGAVAVDATCVVVELREKPAA